jgi:hypothetical protein
MRRAQLVVEPPLDRRLFVGELCPSAETDPCKHAGSSPVQAWGDLAENLASSLTKGQSMIVIGQLRQRRFEANGQHRDRDLSCREG